MTNFNTKNYRTRLIIATFLIVTITLAFSISYYYARGSPSSTLVFEHPASDYSYLIWVEDGTVYAKNGLTGEIENSGTNASAIINAAIGNMSASLGGIIYFREGVYNIDGTITIDRPVTLQGQGPGGPMFGHAWFNATTNVNMITVNIISSYQYFPCINQLGFHGNDRNIIAINQLSGFNLQVINCIINRFATGAIQIDADSSHLIQSNCIEHCGFALKINNPEPNVGTIRFLDNHVGSAVYGLYIYTWTPISPYWGLIASNNFFFKHSLNTIYLRDTSNITISNNVFMYPSSTYQNIYIRDCEKIDIKGNTISMNNDGLNGIFLNNSSEINVIGNSFFEIATGQKAYVDDTGDNTGSGLVKNNFGFVTENSGTQTCADNEDIAHGLAGTPDYVSVTPLNDTYDGVPVIATVDWSNVDATNIQVGLYWVNGTAISDDVILVAWEAVYEP